MTPTPEQLAAADLLTYADWERSPHGPMGWPAQMESWKVVMYQRDEERRQKAALASLISTYLYRTRGRFSLTCAFPENDPETCGCLECELSRAIKAAVSNPTPLKGAMPC